MGFFSKVWKGIRKGVKNVFKGVKKVVSKAWKEVKRFAKSDLGKVVIAAAAIYFGGQALGYWGEGAAQAAATTGELAASTVPGSLEGVALSGADLAAMGAPEAMVAQQAGAGAGLGSLSNVALSGADMAAMGAPQSMVAQQAGQVAGTTGSGLVEATKVLGKKAVDPNASWFDKTLQWTQDNPALTLAGGQALSAAFAEDPYDTWRKQQEWMRQNSNYYGVSGSGGGQPIGLGLISRVGQQNQSQLEAPTVPGAV